MRTNQPKNVYVPPGFIPVDQGVEANDILVQNASQRFDAETLELFFEGNMEKSTVRRDCWANLQTAPYFKRFQHRFWLFDQKQWQDILLEGNRIYLNIHRNPLPEGKEQRPLETVRVGRLLSMDAVILTEQINSLDAKLYDGMILVEENLCGNHTLWSPFLKDLLGNNTKLRLWQIQAYNTFKTSFSPEKLMADAKVWDGGRLFRSCEKARS